MVNMHRDLPYFIAHRRSSPTGSGDSMSLGGVAQEIQHRNTHTFARDYDGRRAYNAGNSKFDFDPHFRDLLQFHEFFHADTGAGLGASHQTGWSALCQPQILFID